MIILGLDPGSFKLGYCLIETDPNRPPQAPVAKSVIKIGVINAPKPKSRLERLRVIFRELTEIVRFQWVSEKKIDIVVIEEAHLRGPKFASAVIPLAEVRGMAIAIAINFDAVVTQYHPSEARKFVLAKGSADKGAVQHAVKRMLNLQELPPLDASDAGCLAIAEALNPEHKRRK